MLIRLDHFTLFQAFPAGRSHALSKQGVVIVSQLWATQHLLPCSPLQREGVASGIVSSCARVGVE